MSRSTDSAPAAPGGFEEWVERCNAITSASGSNLWLVSRALPRLRHRFFTVAYASMRVVDDFVDDQFMALPGGERAERRSWARGRVRRWADQSAEAAEGRFDPGAPDAWEPAIFAALNVVLGRSTLGADPWRRLAAALTDDIDEVPLLTWDDFLRYCRGATVAPAHIFLYVLASETAEDGSSRHDPGLPLLESAIDMGTFCYIVHICRDLRKDALASGLQLVTIPEEVLAAHGLDRAALREDLGAGRHDRAAGLLEDLMERARPFREASERRLEALVPRLGARERGILEGLLGVYLRLDDRLRRDPSAVLRGESLLGFRDKLEILGKAGIRAVDLVR